MNILDVKNVSKSFGEHKVLEGLNLSVPEHCVYGFIGKNGSGKTTTMKMILGLLKASTGEITVCGEKVVYGDTKTNQYIGYLPDVPEFYSYMTPKEYLLLCGEIKGMEKKLRNKKAEELLELVGLKNDNRRIKGFSRGMKQRLGIAQALFHEPRLLICDEPTSALDPVGRKEILDILSIVKEKTTVIFSTHILADVERICDYVGVLDQGKIRLEGEISQIKSLYQSDKVELIIDEKEETVKKIAMEITKLFSIKAIECKEQVMSLTLDNLELQSRQILQYLLEREITLLKFERMEPSLEKLFLGVIQ